MLSRSYLILILLFFYSFQSYADCDEVVNNEYLVVTENPDLVLKNIGTQNFKTGSNKFFIYDHRTNSQYFKVTKSNSVQSSTLHLTLEQKELSKIKNIEKTFVYQNCVANINQIEETQTPNDPLYSSQWALQLLNYSVPNGLAPKQKIKIAISDTGFDYLHEDLNSNLWVNSSELNGKDGIDDDNNGCIDDIHGCDVADNDPDVDVNTYKSNLIDHGTHVAGIIGAVSNNSIGITGVASNIELILIKAFSSKRKTTTADLLRSIYYAVDSGASILNCSWGSGSKPNLAEFNAFEYARLNDVVVVVAAGNSSTYASKTSPAGLTNVLTVGSHNSKFQLSTFSNFGTSVDILASGGDGVERRNESILSLGINNTYTQKKGTSMASPIVAASLAIIKSYFPQLTRNELINLVLENSDSINVTGFYDSTYRADVKALNLEKAFEAAQKYSETNSTSFLYEPKTISKPQTSSSVDNTNFSEDFSSNSTNGCARNNLNSTATLPSMIILLLPLFLLWIKKKELKK